MSNAIKARIQVNQSSYPVLFFILFQGDCPPPLISVQRQGSTSCVWPCQDTSAPYYYFTDHTCKSFCSDPYQAQEKQYGTACDLVLSEDQQKEVKDVVLTTNAGNILNSFSTSTVAIISPGNTAVITGGTLVKMLGYTRYVDVNHPPTLEGVFINFKASTGVLDSKQLRLYAANKFSSKTPPQVFDKYNISPVFILGFWIGIVSLSVISSIVLIVVLLHRGFSNLWKDSTHKPTIRKSKGCSSKTIFFSNSISAMETSQCTAYSSFAQLYSVGVNLL